MDSCHSLQCESRKERIYNEGELDSEPPQVSGKNPKPALWRDENYEEAFEERKING